MCHIHGPVTTDSLAEIEGATQYLVTTGKIYSIPTKSDDIDPDVLVNGTTPVRLKVLQARTVVKKRGYAVVMRFWRSISDNIRECLQPRYYEQLYEPVFTYKRVRPRSYINNLNTKWVILDKLQIEEMTPNCRRGWDTDKPFTTCLHRLDREQVALLKDNITISDANKNIS
jgi:hypothetical protein